jgi:hypothetical protein
MGKGEVYTEFWWENVGKEAICQASLEMDYDTKMGPLKVEWGTWTRLM